MAYAADKKPGELTALTTLATDDVFVVGDTSDTSEVAKGITKANLITDLTTSFAPALTADQNYVSDAQLVVVGNTSGTNTGDNAVNSNYSGLVTNATHTGEVTGATALTVDKTAITGKTLATAVGTDYVLISDTSDSGNLKKALASDLAGSALSDGDKGDITVSASGATWTIDAGAVTLAKQADMATASVVYRKTAGSGAPEVNTLATLKTDLGLSNTNSGDQTSIVGITGTKAQFDTAVTDGNFMYIGDAPTSHTHLLAAGATDVTASAAEVNILDGATLTVTELNYVDGVTSAIQTQLDAKLPLAGGTMTGNLTLGENTSIDLDPAGSADGKYSGICITGTAGAALAFGDLIYLAAADSRWELTDADATATAGTPLLGMCVLAAAGDASATKILLQGTIRADAKFPALTIGAPAYVGETAGAIQTAIPTGADNVIRVVGRALTADELYFCPSQDHQITVA